MQAAISMEHISQKKKLAYNQALENIPTYTTRSIPCGKCKRYFLLNHKMNGDIVYCPECGAEHRVKQKVVVKTSVELVTA